MQQDKLYASTIAHLKVGCWLIKYMNVQGFEQQQIGGRGSRLLVNDDQPFQLVSQPEPTTAATAADLQASCLDSVHLSSCMCSHIRTRIDLA